MKLSKKLWSAITDDLDHCIECGGPKEQIHHCLYGTKRKHADEDRLTVLFCASCHNRLHNTDHSLALKYMRIAQATYEESHGHAVYMERYGKNYLD